MMRDQFGALRRWKQDYGGLFEVNFGPASFVIAADPNTAGEMLIQGGNVFMREGVMYEPMKPLFGSHSMINSEGPIWRNRRRALNPHFRQRAVAAMAERIDASLERILTKIEPGPTDIYTLTGAMSMSVALSVMYGRDLERPELERLGRAIDHTIGRIAVGWITSQLPRWLPIPGRRRYRRELAFIDDLIAMLIRERRESGDLGDDMFGMLLHMAEPPTQAEIALGQDQPLLDTVAIRNESVALISAGYETTANAMAWALDELARRPEIFARVRAEADAALVEGEAVTSPKLLPYTTCVFNEALRMYPSAIWVPRSAAEDGELAGYPIAKGTAMLCSPYLVQHDPHAWVDPDRFDPERFAEDTDQPRVRHAFMPFGLGQHMCMGKHLAMLEGPVLLAHMVQRWDMAPIPGREPQMKISTTMTAKNGIWLELSPRAGS